MSYPLFHSERLSPQAKVTFSGVANTCVTGLSSSLLSSFLTGGRPAPKGAGNFYDVSATGIGVLNKILGAITVAKSALCYNKLVRLSKVSGEPSSSRFPFVLNLATGVGTQVLTLAL
jgi:hypothetical protein